MPGIRPLNPQLEEKAKQELNEDPARRTQDIQHIKEWLKKQPHLNARMDDQWILTFLRGCKFSLERTKEKLDTFYTMRTALPEIFSNRDPSAPEIQEVLKAGILLPMKEKDNHGYRLYFFRSGCYDPSKITFESIVKTSYMMLDLALMEDDDFIINGFSQIMDFENASLAHARALNLVLAKKVSLVFQEAYPLRPKAIHYYKPPGFMEKVISFFKSFLKEKIKKRIIIHTSEESLLQHVTKAVLPKEFGGDGPSIEAIAAEWKKRLEENRAFFVEDDKYKSNEKKRPGKPKTSEDLFGIEGSFRQLNFD